MSCDCACGAGSAKLVSLNRVSVGLVKITVYTHAKTYGELPIKTLYVDDDEETVSTF